MKDEVKKTRQQELEGYEMVVKALQARGFKSVMEVGDAIELKGRIEQLYDEIFTQKDKIKEQAEQIETLEAKLNKACRKRDEYMNDALFYRDENKKLKEKIAEWETAE